MELNRDSIWQKNSSNRLKPPHPSNPRRKRRRPKHQRAKPLGVRSLRRRRAEAAAQAAASTVAVVEEAAAVVAADSAAADAAGVIAIAAAKPRKAESNLPSSASIAAPKSSRAAEPSASAHWLSPETVAAALASATARPTKCRHRSRKPPRTPARRCSR